MQAICISDDWPVAKKHGVYAPICGETVEIISTFIHPIWGAYYELQKGPPRWGYDAYKFVPIDQNEESSFMEKEQIQKQEVLAIVKEVIFGTKNDSL